MNEIGVVFTAEFMRKIRSRIFMVATLVGVVAIMILLAAPSFLTKLERSSTDGLVLAGAPAIRDRVATLLARRHAFQILERVEALPAAVTPEYLDAHHHAAAAIGVSIKNARIFLDIYPRDLSAFADRAFSQLVPLNLELVAGLQIAKYDSAVHVDRAVHPIDRRFADSTSAGTAHGVAFGLIFILYLAIILAAQSVMAAVAEEKTSRIAEILVATISPTNLLVGKTLAAAAIAMVQIAAWLTTAMVVIPRVAAKSHASDFAAASASNNPAAAMPSFFVDPGVIVTFVVFFVLGYLQFATIYAAAASLISRTEDLGSVTTPLVMPVVGAFFIAQYSLSQPDAPVSVAFSFVPFVSPFVIFTRIAVSAVPAWQIALAIVINALAVAIAFYVSGKIYRVGMLLYGKMPSLKQIWAAIRT